MIRIPRDVAEPFLVWLHQMGADRDNAPVQASSFYKMLLKQVQGDGGSRHQGDLIETIASILMHPKARNILSGSLLDSLRESLLSPREMAETRALAKTRMGCGVCGRDLVNGEAVTFKSQEPVCTECSSLQFVACTGCRGVLSVPPSVAKIFAKLRKECPGCQAKLGKMLAAKAAGDPMPVDAPPTLEQMGDDLDRLIEADREIRRQRDDMHIGADRVQRVRNGDDPQVWRAQIPPTGRPVRARGVIPPAPPLQPRHVAWDIETPLTLGQTTGQTQATATVAFAANPTPLDRATIQRWVGEDATLGNPFDDEGPRP